MRPLFALAVTAAFTQTIAAQTTRTVPSATYPTIQSAITASISGDTVLVLPGTYTENLNMGGLDLTVRGLAGAAATTIDGGGLAATILYPPGSTRNALLDGFTIVNGRGSSVATPSITPGGGIAMRGSSPTIQNCTVRNCSSPSYGGGIGGTPTIVGAVPPEPILPCSPRIFNCLVDANNANTASFASGGGICFTGFLPGAIVGAPEIEQCIIRSNTALARGGGIYVGYNQNALIKDCVITRNRTNATTGSLDGGAGIWYALNAQPLIVNCTIFSNVSNSNGGGVKFFNVSGGRVLNCTIVNNTGGSIAGINNTGSFGAGTNSNVVNCICWNNGAVETDVRGTAPLPVINMTYTDIAGGFAGTGNISADPQILNLASTNQRLTAASPCINAGDNTAVGLPANDFEGDPRVLAGTVDMGADEFNVNAVFLTADRGTVSVATGGTINLQVNGGSSRANMVYVILPSLGGTRPGIDLGSLHLPLNFDGSSVILLSAYASTLGGALNAGGGGSGAMALGTSLPPGLVGQTISFAAVVIDLSLQINAFSNDENVDFLQ